MLKTEVVIAMRSFAPAGDNGTLSRENLSRLDSKSDAMWSFALAFRALSGKSAHPMVITTKDLSGYERIFEVETGLRVFTADTKAKNSGYAAMLNTALEAADPNTPLAIISPSLLKDPVPPAQQLAKLANIFGHLNNVSILGSAIEGDHDLGLIQAAIDGTQNLTLENICRVFPNNSFSMVPPGTRFSEKTDNGALGSAYVGEKQVPIGGNEEFYLWLESIASRAKDCFLLVQPALPGERDQKVLTVQEKYGRRQAVYARYVKELFGDNPKTDLEHAINRHLFFVRMSEDGQPEAMLTAKQKEMGIASPLLS